MSDLDRLLAAVRSSQILRLCLVGALTLVLLIPVAMIGALVYERQQRYGEVLDEVSESWGRAQQITGPVLVLPYEVPVVPAEGEPAVPTTRRAVFLPRELAVEGRMDTESRQRGIFSVPVFRLTSEFEGVFDSPDLQELGIDPESVVWDRAELVIGISDVRAIGGRATLLWDDLDTPFLPGATAFPEAGPGVHAAVPVSPDGVEIRFSFSLSLDGSRSLYLGPFAGETRVRLDSNSSYPSFQGNWLPAERSVTEDGFEASWRVSYLGRNYPQAWVSTDDFGEAIDQSRFGVELVSPVDHYRMAERSVKYAALFILLTFAVVWLTEVLAGARVHPIQYLMLGAALCLFYLLELSLAEHVGFGAAYAIASLAIIGMVAFYGRVIFGFWRRSGMVTTSVAVLYGYLFVLLTNEDAALLVGSVGLFLVLGTIMFLTRRIDWYAGSARGGRSD